MATVTKADRVKQRALAAVAGAKVQGYKLAARAQTAKAKARSK